MPRKIIQISNAQVENTYHTQSEFVTIALCDDGSVWKLFNNVNAVWERLPDIPQDKIYRKDPPPPTVEYRNGY